MAGEGECLLENRETVCGAFKAQNTQVCGYCSHNPAGEGFHFKEGMKVNDCGEAPDTEE